MQNQNEIQKPIDILISEESEILISNLINTIQSSQLPLSIRKLITVSTLNDISHSIDMDIEKQKQTYYTQLANQASQDEPTSEDTE